MTVGESATRAVTDGLPPRRDSTRQNAFYCGFLKSTFVWSSARLGLDELNIYPLSEEISLSYDATRGALSIGAGTRSHRVGEWPEKTNELVSRSRAAF